MVNIANYSLFNDFSRYPSKFNTLQDKLGGQIEWGADWFWRCQAQVE